MTEKVFLLMMLALMQPKEDLRFQHVHEQGFDQSCGFSAVSSLLDIYWHESVNESVLMAEYLLADTNRITATNSMTTLSDLSMLTGKHGLKNKAYRMTFEQLEKAVKDYAPVLVHYEEPEKHFALVLCIKENRVITADPARGNEVVMREIFEERWSGVVLLAASTEKKKDTETLEEAVGKANGRYEFLERQLWK